MFVVGRMEAGDLAGRRARTEMETIARGLEEQHVFNKGHVGDDRADARRADGARDLVAMCYAAHRLAARDRLLQRGQPVARARAASRGREMAIRVSLGAGRSSPESNGDRKSHVGNAGGVLGIALARWSLDALIAFAPAGLLRVDKLFVDGRVLAYAVAVSSVTGLVIGLVPAVLLVRSSLTS